MVSPTLKQGENKKENPNYQNEYRSKKMVKDIKGMRNNEK